MGGWTTTTLDSDFTFCIHGTAVLVLFLDCGTVNLWLRGFPRLCYLPRGVSGWEDRCRAEEYSRKTSSEVVESQFKVAAARIGKDSHLAMSSVNGHLYNLENKSYQIVTA